MPIYLAGGVQKHDAQQRSGEHRYAFARILRLDAKGGESVAYEHKSPPEFTTAQDPSVVFTAAYMDPERVVVPSKTEVLMLRREGAAFVLAQRLDSPLFNDLHHARPDPVDPSQTWVVNTGLDQVLRFSGVGELLEAFSCVPGDPWARFDRRRDYRKVPSTKPHTAHPNYLVFLGGEPWVTRFEQRDCVRLADASAPVIPAAARMPIGFAGCHDGVPLGDAVYFTSVDGNVVRTRPGLSEPEAVWDLNHIDGGVRRLGWCRGLWMLDEQRALVGFSRLRVTKWVGNIAWAGGLNSLRALAHRPTRVACIDLEHRRIEWEHEVEGLDAIFSIHRELEATEAGP